jgi:hypothetical protein
VDASVGMSESLNENKKSDNKEQGGIRGIEMEVS